jgi:hypothetical protein
LAEQAGFTVITGDVRDSGDSKGVDAGDVEVGDGEAPVRKGKVRGK